jgi:hypothetical protein
MKITRYDYKVLQVYVATCNTDSLFKILAGQQQLTPVIPATWEAKKGGRIVVPGQPRQKKSVIPHPTEKNPAWRYTL